MEWSLEFVHLHLCHITRYALYRLTGGMASPGQALASVSRFI